MFGGRPLDRPARQHLVEQVDPPSGRVHLLAPEGIRGAGGQTKPAVDAIVDQFLGHGQFQWPEPP